MKGGFNAAKPLSADFALQNRRSPSNPPSSPRTSLHDNRHIRFGIIFNLAYWRLSCREVFGWIGRCAAVKRAASRLFGGWGAFTGYALHKCRDSACRRPFGVRRNAVGVCSEMTRRLGALWDITYLLQCYYLLIYDYDALPEGRDSACRRPFGVRLRGNGWLSRSPSRRRAAPLRMTQWVWCFVRYNRFVAMLL